MPNRRTFIKQTSMATAAILLSPIPMLSVAEEHPTKICILHTNDTQSVFEAFAVDAPKYAGLGGMQNRANLIEKIRQECEHVLLLDAGDFFQGSPYFDIFKGAAEIDLMNEMGYDAACIGEHEFDEGIDNLAHQIKRAKFNVLCANYDFRNTALQDTIKDHTIIEKGKIKMGIFGIGINLKGLCTADIADKIGFEDPIKIANEKAYFLKHKMKCDFVICLSHLGLNNANHNAVTDKDLATKTTSIDLIIGGHSHQLLDKPLKFWNTEKKEVLVAQVGWGGAYLGRIDCLFSTKKNILSTNAQTVEILK